MRRESRVSRIFEEVCKVFKTVFSKYFTAFMAIFLLSFSLLGAILYISVRDYAVDEKKETVANAAENIRETLRLDYQEYLKEDPARNISGYFVDSKESVSRTISALSDYSSYTIFLVDKDGTIRITDNNGASLSGSLPAAFAQNLFRDGRVETMGDLDGILDGDHFVYGVKLGMNLSAGVPAGGVIACTSTRSLTAFANRIIKVFIAACLLVMGLGLLTCYLLSRRISTPLREMGVAAKKFASGDFSVRVAEDGGDEVAELAGAFNQMAKSLEENEQLRSGFISNVSHELRTPLTSISGFVEGMQDGVIPPEKHEYYLGIVGSEVKRLSRLVTTLLDITKIQAGERKFVPVPFDICEMARQILISFENKIEAKKLKIDFFCEEENMRVSADSDAIHQVLYNLIDNAVKFTKEEGLLRVSLKYNGKKVQVKVYNEGQGIPQEDLDHVFDRFYKADKSRGIDRTGVGLGLYIVKTIIVSHGEQITVDSAEGEWCDFTFTLPKI